VSDPGVDRRLSNELLAVIPARSGSKGVPGKTLRLLAGRPMIAYTVAAIRAAGITQRLVVSSDSPEVLAWAERESIEALDRPAELALDDVPVAAVAHHAAQALDWNSDVGLFQPTSPFCSGASIAAAYAAFKEAESTSLSSAVRVRHLFWLDESDDLTRPRPLFTERVNRQYARHRVLRETGAIQLVAGAELRATGRLVSDRHMLFEIPEDESLDIDTLDDLMAARRRLERGLVIFRVRANRVFGSGHIHHCLQLAEELADHHLKFLLRECDPFVMEALDERGYEWLEETDLPQNLAGLVDRTPAVIVNDVLDTTEAEVLRERLAGLRVLNIEDLGPGAEHADRVINALYPIRPGAAAHVDSGPSFATLRSEFFGLPPKVIHEHPQRILITFGGTDPSHLAARCARVLAGQVDVELRVVIGPGAEEAEFPPGVEVRRHVRTMASEMLAADLVLTSAGRTVYEAAAVGTPVVVLAQSAREATHAHLDFGSGVVFLGIGALVDDAHMLEVVRRILSDQRLRQELSDRLQASVDGLGARRVAERIRMLLLGL